MSGIEANNVDVYHHARVVHTELEPVVVSEVSIECLESSSVILLVKGRAHFVLHAPRRNLKSGFIVDFSL